MFVTLKLYDSQSKKRARNNLGSDLSLRKALFPDTIPNVTQKIVGALMPTKYAVGLIGFNTVESGKMVKVFQLTQSKDRHYQIKPVDNMTEVDLLLVNIDSDYMQIKNDYLKLHPETIVVTVSKKQNVSTETPWHIKGLLLAIRVIKTLDSIPLSKKNNKPLLETGINKVSRLLQIADADTHIESVTTGLPDKFHNYDFDVLVVDDSPAMQKNLANELINASHSIGIDFADSGEIALNKINQKKYDFIFLDVMMPGIDGYETCTRLRTIKGMKKTPVIMLSAKTSPLDEVKGVMAGCTCYLTKPINSVEFQKMLTRVMGWLQDFKKPQTIMES